MIKKRAAVLVTSIVASVLASTGAAAPASATEECRGGTVGHQTISVFGQPVATTPRVGGWICVRYPSNVPTPPSLEVTTTPARSVQLVHPDAGGEEISVFVTFELSPSSGPTIGPSHEIPVPIPTDGGKTCLFFQGNAVYNPGGCVVAIEGATPLDDVLDDLP